VRTDDVRVCTACCQDGFHRRHVRLLSLCFGKQPTLTQSDMLVVSCMNLCFALFTMLMGCSRQGEGKPAPSKPGNRGLGAVTDFARVADIWYASMMTRCPTFTFWLVVAQNGRTHNYHVKYETPLRTVARQSASTSAYISAGD
jgi:hypothetical protein